MRTNLPVTSQEYTLRDDQLIVSKTDLKGRITYVNRDFLEISGYTEQELIGEPHNILRHPDMPAEAFEDLWRTLKEGRPWTGYVKNRCKNGDYYWVLANAAPIVENGKTTGYISVRRKASAEAVAAHEAAYKLFKEKKQGNLVIHYGKAVKKGHWSLDNVGIGPKLWGSIAVVVLFAAIALGSSWFGMSDVQHRFGNYMAQEQKLLDSYSEMYAQGLQMGQAVRNILLDPVNKKAYENHAKAQRDFNDQLAIAKSVSAATPDIRKSLEEIGALSTKHFDVQARIIEAVKAGNLAEARSALNSDDTPLWRKYKQMLIEGRKSLAKKADAGEAEVRATVTTAGRISLLFGLVALVVAAMTAIFLGRMIRRPMEEMDSTFANVLQGNYTNVIDIARSDEIGTAMQGLQILQTRMGFEVAETKRVSSEMSRIKIALDGAAMPLTISDDSNELIYMNQAAHKLWSGLAPALAKRFPGFGPDWLIGKRIADYFEEEEAKSAYRADLEETRTLEAMMGGHTLRVTATPVRDAKGAYLGRASQWVDRTQELAAEREIQEIVQAALVGDYSPRIDLAGKEGFFATLGEGLNEVLNSTAQALTNTSRVLGKIAQGDLTQKIVADYSGIFGQLKDDTNTTVEHLRQVVGRIKDAAEAIDTSAKEIAAGNQDLSSRTEEQASSLEETSSSMEELNSTVQQNADNAKRANELTGKSNEVAMRGGLMVRQVVDTMSGIQASSHKIADIVSVIDSIAFQTNILALNAAVEAARAGEQGRGFAVVATEVRNLAQRSATAAKEIKQLIAESVGKVESGAQLVHESGETMDEVVTSFKLVADLVTEISNASREQSSGIGQVTQAVTQMDEVTQQNAALVEEAAAAAESLEEQARALVLAVGMFKLTEGAANGPAPALRDVTPKQLSSSVPPRERAKRMGVHAAPR